MVKTMFTRITFSLGILAMLIAISCDRVPLLAPTNSSVTLDAGSRVVETGGSTSLSAMVIESSGTPVQNGTTVRFTTSLGRVDPVESQTRNGIATTTFFAGDASGVAEVRATSGGAGGSSTTPTTPPSNGNGTNGTTTTTTTSSNVVQISVGAGAVDTITLSANPSTVSKTANTPVTIVATVVGTGGRLLSGIPVSFSSNRGTFSSQTATTSAQGEARVTLTTNDTTKVTAVAGTKTATVDITGQEGPSISLTCSVTGASGCASVSQGQTVVFTAARGGTSSSIASSTLDFGDGTGSVNLGPLSSAASVPHTYNQAGTFTAVLTATDINGETTSSTQVVQVSAATGTITTTKSGNTVTATATVSAPATQYAWNFGDGFTTTTTTNVAQHLYTVNGTYTISVTATLQSGGTVTANTSVAVP
jgi:PKD repeat protein